MKGQTGGIIFVVGGAKSGKSSFALGRAETLSGRKAYIATAEPLDEEMKNRIEDHRSQRDEDWETIEEPVDVARVLDRLGDGYGAVVIDCLTLWVSNLLCRDRNAGEAIEAFLNSLLSASRSSLFLVVSNEVGMGIVPDNALSRRFRDLAGNLNQKVAAIADEVYLVAAGIPLKIKP